MHQYCCHFSGHRWLGTGNTAWNWVVPLTPFGPTSVSTDHLRTQNLASLPDTRPECCVIFLSLYGEASTCRTVGSVWADATQARSRDSGTFRIGIRMRPLCCLPNQQFAHRPTHPPDPPSAKDGRRSAHARLWELPLGSPGKNTIAGSE